jgi:2-oxoglutarate ferredoxin oxidoreductase subunit alpha
MARICKTSLNLLEKDCICVGLARPITLYPYPYKAIQEAAEKAKAVLVIEMSTGQMIDDVKLSLEGKRPIHFYGRTGGIVPSPEEVCEQAKKLIHKA